MLDVYTFLSWYKVPFRVQVEYGFTSAMSAMES